MASRRSPRAGTHAGRRGEPQALGHKRSALLLFGIAYDEAARPEFAIDFRYSVQNYKDTFVNGFLAANGRAVDVFLCAREASERVTRALLGAWTPLRHHLTSDVTPPAIARNGHLLAVLNRNVRLIGVIRLCLEAARERTYELVVITRFDLVFTLPLRFLSIDPEAFNVATHLARNQIDDNLYVLPFRLLRPLHDLMTARMVANATSGAPTDGPTGSTTATTTTTDGLELTWAHEIKGRLERTVAPVSFIMDQSRHTYFWNQSLLTLVRCKRPHGLSKECVPASGPRGLDTFGQAPAFGNFDAVRKYKQRLVHGLLRAARRGCKESRGPFAPHAPPAGRTTNGSLPLTMAPGSRVLLVRLRGGNMGRLNGTIGCVLGGAPSGRVRVQVISPRVHAESESNRPIHWTLRPSNLLPGHGATPEERRWCAQLESVASTYADRRHSV